MLHFKQRTCEIKSSASGDSDLSTTKVQTQRLVLGLGERRERRGERRAAARRQRPQFVGQLFGQLLSIYHKDDYYFLYPYQAEISCQVCNGLNGLDRCSSFEI